MTIQRPASDAARARLYFAGLVLLEIWLAALLWWDGRFPEGHDGFQFFSLGYYFLNNAEQGGGLAQWMPFMTQGTVSTWWYTVTAGLVQSVAIFLGPGLRAVPLLAVLHAGFLADQLVLLTGLWLVCRRLFMRAETALLVCAAVLGSTTWVTQPWFNLTFYYAVPLLIHLGHRFLETGRWRYFLAALNLLAVQTLGNLPYYIPVTTFLLACWFGGYAVLNTREVWAQVRTLRWGWRAAVAIVGGLASIYLAYKIIGLGTAEIMNYNRGREANGTVGLDVFLTYAGPFKLAKLQEWWLGIPSGLDFTLYLGVLALPLALWGLVTVRRAQAHVLVFAAGMLALALALPVAAPLLYYTWPGMKFYRHLVDVAVFLKIPMALLAGVGFEDWFSTTPVQRGKFARAAAGLLALACVGVAAEIALLGSGQGVMAEWIAAENATGQLDSPLIQHIADSPPAIVVFAGFALAAALVLGLRAIKQTPPRGLALAAVTLLVFDVYTHKAANLFWGTDSTDRVPTLFAPQRFTFATRREPILSNLAPRMASLRSTTDLLGARNWTMDSFAFVDELGSTYRVDHWLRPLDALMRAYWGLPTTAQPQAPPGWLGQSLFFPLPLDSARKVTGVASPGKIQFFDAAWTAPNDDTAAAWLTNPAFAGDTLVLAPAGESNTAPPASEAPAAAVPRLPEETSPAAPPLAAQHRLDLNYHIMRFDANNLTIQVNNPTSQPAWLYYADVWHSGWSALVNGQKTAVRRADLAYKAVAIAPGENTVEFRFAIPHFAAIAEFFAVCAALWLLVLAGYIAAILFPAGRVARFMGEGR